MTRTHPSFPIAFRLLAVTLALAAVAVASSVAGATPSKQDVERANAKVDALLAEVHDARNQLSVIDARLAIATAQVDAAEGRLEALTAQLLDTRARLEQARSRYDEITGRLNERAAQAFMNGPASNVEFLLGSSSLGELSDRLEFVDAVAQSDADLAGEVENLRIQLETDEASLESLQTAARKEHRKAEARKRSILADFTLQQDLLASIDAKLAEAKRYEQKVSKAYKAAIAAAASQGYGGGHSSVPMPPGWEHVLQVCPTGSPRSYGDGFGAPRYAGGYHLHKGVDMLAPMRHTDLRTVRRVRATRTTTRSAATSSSSAGITAPSTTPTSRATARTRTGRSRRATSSGTWGTPATRPASRTTTSSSTRT